MIAGVRIALKDAIHVKGAEFWLKLGEPYEALQELDQIRWRTKIHPWATFTFIAALRAFCRDSRLSFRKEIRRDAQQRLPQRFAA